jgi:hypothetical protein
LLLGENAGERESSFFSSLQSRQSRLFVSHLLLLNTKVAMERVLRYDGLRCTTAAEQNPTFFFLSSFHPILLLVTIPTYAIIQILSKALLRATLNLGGGGGENG